jgi:hypothetical protein
MSLPMPPRRRVAWAVGLLAVLALAACQPSQVPTTEHWPRPDDPMALAEAAGLTPEPEEHLDTHTHAHLDVFIDGEPILVPGGIGVDTEASTIQEQPLEEPEMEGQTGFFLISPCDAPCLSPLHTHAGEGLLHTESSVADAPPFTLGQFFTEWDVRLDEDCVGEFCAPETPIAVYVDGERYDGNPAQLELTTHLVIVIAIGEEPDSIPSSWQWDAAP